MNPLLRIMLRKCIVLFKKLGRLKNRVLLLLLLLYLLILVTSSWRLAQMTSKALLPPLPPDQSLDHFRRNTSLAHYMEHISLLIEPSSTPCSDLEEVPLIIMVTSAPSRWEQRQAVRATWSRYQPTYFLLGLDGQDSEDILTDNYIEAKQYSDMIVYDFIDHYQNLTLKTGLMLQWTIDRCPQAQFMLKTDDDVLVNPWTMRTVLKDNTDAKLLGYKNSAYLHRDLYTKWYIPRWLYPEDNVPEYLCGPGYLIKGEHLSRILKAAYQVSLVNLEDIYFTYLVAKKTLGLSLTHERRLSQYRPWLPMACAYWTLALSHSYRPEEMRIAWQKLELISSRNYSDNCSYFDRFLMNRDFWLY